MRSPQLLAKLELGAFKLSLTHNEFLDFVTLSLGDWLEQVEGASDRESDGYGWLKGEAWGYRRKAFEAMSEILIRERGLGLAKSTWRAVYAAEPEATRRLEQRRTPPLSKEAKKANDVWMSTVGDDEREKLKREWKVEDWGDEEEKTSG